MTEKQRAQTAARQQRFRERQAEARRAEQVVKRLPALPAITTMPGQARWRSALVAARLLVEQVHEEMQGYYDDRSEAWQESDAGAEFVERQEGVVTVPGQLDELTM